MSIYKKLENTKAEIRATIDGEVWANAQKKAFNKLVKNLEIKGFRKGSVPANMAKKFINDNEVLINSVEACIDDVFKAAIAEHDAKLIAQPELKVETLDKDHAEVVFNLTVEPDVTLGDYKTLGYKVTQARVSEAEVEEEVKKLVERHADLELKEEGTVENGDTAVIDFEGFKDGVAFEGGKGENYPLVIGSGSFIPGFEEQLIGMKSEESKDINVTFPEDYQAADLAGKEVVFKVTVHDIKTKVLPEVNDEFVKDLEMKDVNTVDELKAKLKEDKKAAKKAENENKAVEELLNKFLDVVTVDIPEIMVNDQVNNMFQDQAYRMQSQGISIDAFLKYTGQTVEAFKDSLKEEALKRLKTTMGLEAVAKAENVAPTEEEVEKEVTSMAAMYGMSNEDVKKYVSVDDIKKQLVVNKALEILKK